LKFNQEITFKSIEFNNEFDSFRRILLKVSKCITKNLVDLTDIILSGFSAEADTVMGSVQSGVVKGVSSTVDLFVIKLGILSKSLKGYKTEGVGGLIKGGLSGARDLVSKPIDGFLEGVLKERRDTNKNKNKEISRMEFSKSRFPRVFFGDERVIKRYHHIDALIACKCFGQLQEVIETENS
jgi:hypothetical protein